MYRFILLSLIGIFFIGCSEKINPAEFHPIPAQKAPIQPTQREIKYKPNVIIFPKDNNNYYENKAKEVLSSLLINSKYVNILDRHSNIQDEIKLAENAKATNSNLNQADYIIVENITPKSYNEKYTPPKYYKDKKGRIYKIPGYYTYEACSSGYIKIYSTIPYQLISSLYANKCYSTTSTNHENIKKSVQLESIKSAIEDIKYNIYKIFTPKGYIFEIRKKGDKIILHTTLGKDKGAKEGEKVDIYTKKIIKLPFNKKTEIEEQKIGEGVISNVVNAKDSWVIVKDYKEMPKIGDYIKMNYNFSIWDIFK